MPRYLVTLVLCWHEDAENKHAAELAALERYLDDNLPSGITQAIQVEPITEGEQ